MKKKCGVKMIKLTDNLVFPDEYSAETIQDYRQNAPKIETGLMQSLSSPFIPGIYIHLHNVLIENRNIINKSVSPKIMAFKIRDNTNEDFLLWDKEENPCEFLENLKKKQIGYADFAKDIFFRYYLKKDFGSIISVDDGYSRERILKKSGECISIPSFSY